MRNPGKKESQEQKSNPFWFLILGISAITIYFKTNAEDPFNTPKLMLLLLVAGWLLGHIIDNFRINNFKLKSKELINFSFVLFFICGLLVSTLMTDVRLVGFIGDTQRRNGFLAYLCLGIIIIFTAQVINFEFAIRIFKVAVLMGTLLSAYGLMQILGKDFVDWNNPYNNMISTLGNPNFASSMLAILFILGLSSIFISEIQVFYKILSLFMLVMSIFAIVKSQSRQGLLVIIFSLIFYVSIYFYFNRKKISIPLICMSFTLFVLAIFGMLQKGPFAAILYKDSVSVRGYYWRAGFEMFKEHPFTGVGVDRYGAYFKQFREVGYPLKYGYTITSSNAHNTIIQLFATAGFFVGLSYLAILLLILSRGLSLVKKTSFNQQKIALALLSAWIGFQAQSFISIDNIGVSVWGWLLGGAILGLEHKNISPPKVLAKNKNVINVFQPLISILVLIPTVYIVVHLYRAESDSFLIRAYTNSTIESNRNIVFNYERKIYDNPLADPFYKLKAMLSIYQMGFQNEAQRKIEELAAKDDINPDIIIILAELALRENNLDKAINYRKVLVKIDPWNAENYLELCKLYKQIGDLENASKMTDLIETFAPESEILKSAKVVLS